MEIIFGSHVETAGADFHVEAGNQVEPIGGGIGKTQGHAHVIQDLGLDAVGHAVEVIDVAGDHEVIDGEREIAGRSLDRGGLGLGGGSNEEERE